MLPQPTPEEVRAARLRARLTQAEAAALISSAAKQPYRTWQDYEVMPSGTRRVTAIPPAVWELFLLKTGQHPAWVLVQRG